MEAARTSETLVS